MAYSLRPPAGGNSATPDAVRDLLSNTRDLHAEQRRRRDQWFSSLTLGNKEQILFEFEVLLKGTACFANPRNHPGPPRRSPVVAQDFKPSAILFRDAAQRSVDLCRHLLGARDRRFVFHRYLETVLPEDSVRAQLAGEGSSQAYPEDSLLALRHGLSNVVEVIEGVLRAPRMPFRLFYASLGLAQREVAQNAYFNPLTALEFRPEFDRIQSPEILRLIEGVPPGEAHRLVALTFLGLFRMLRYQRLLSEIAGEATHGPRSAGRMYFVLSVLRSDARALSDYLQRSSGRLLSESFRRSVWGVKAGGLTAHAEALREYSQKLIATKSALECVAGNLRLEVRRTYYHDIPPPDSNLTARELRAATAAALANLRPALRNTILFLGKALGSELQERGVFANQGARSETSDRLRRDVWMFAQILRAFSSKAEQSPTQDRWGPINEFQYVREFLAYFRSMGYPLLRTGDYPRFDAFMTAMSRLHDADLANPDALSTAIQESKAFHGYLEELFHQISKRQELAGVPFDRRKAAASLRLYLGDGTR
jgi:hypothetical protein